MPNMSAAYILARSTCAIGNLSVRPRPCGLIDSIPMSRIASFAKTVVNSVLMESDVLSGPHVSVTIENTPDDC